MTLGLVKQLERVFVQAKMKRDAIEDQESPEYKRLDLITVDVCILLDKLEAGDY